MRACAVVDLNRSTYYDKSTRDEQALLSLRIKDLALARPRFGYRRIHAILRREGWRINHKRVHRLYIKQGLSLWAGSPKWPRRHVTAKRRNFFDIDCPNALWAMDFVADALYRGRKFRTFPIIDVYTRECLAIAVDLSIKGEQIVAALEMILTARGKPKAIRCDNGPEFISKVLDKWCYENEIELNFSRRGGPTDNAHCESFNGKFRDECLNFHWFMSFADAKEKIEAWRMHYNDHRPHYSLEFMTPSEFAAEAEMQKSKIKKSPKSPI